MRFALIIPAAGASTRFGAGDKLGQDFGGRPLLLRSIEPFTKRDDVHAVIVAGPPDDLDDIPGPVRRRSSVFSGGHGRRGGTSSSGGRRCATPSKPSPSGCTHVAIHDASAPAGRRDALIDSRVRSRDDCFRRGGSGRAGAGHPQAGWNTRWSKAAERDATVDSILGLGEGDDLAGGILGDEPAIGHQVPARRVDGTVDRTDSLADADAAGLRRSN